MMARVLFAFAFIGANLLAQTTATSSARAKALEAYRAWRLADPNLEADAANNPATLGVRSDRVAAESAKYFAAQQVYLNALKAELERTSEQLTENAELPDTARNAGTLGQLAGAANAIANNLGAIANSTDAGLRDLRRALERERTALAAILPAVKEAGNQQAGAAEAARAGVTARKQVATRYREIVSEVAREGETSGKIAAAWADYYRGLAAAAREGSAVSVAAPKPQLREIRETLNPAAAPAPAASVPEVAKEAAAASTSSQAVPLAIRSTAPVAAAPSRYAGDWMYPTVNEHYHGARPESMELSVHEEGGQMRGSFHVKFRLPPTTTVDPIVEFTFSGPYETTRSQSFPIMLPDGTKGTFEMIPATTFNLLEVSFAVDERPGKINRGNFFIIRK